MRSDDIAQLLVKQPAPVTRIETGRLLAWDPDTFKSVTKWNGVELRDLRVLSGMEALSFTVGTPVTLVGTDPTGGRGLQEWAILGRSIDPGTAAAGEAVASLKTAVARQLLKTATISGIGTRNSITYGDLTGVDPGPEIADVEVVGGKLLIFLSCQTTVDIGAGRQGFMGVEINGPTNRLPDDGRAYVVGLGGDPTLDVTGTGQAAEAVIHEGLSPGTYTLTARFRTIDAGGTVQFVNPTMIAVAF